VPAGKADQGFVGRARERQSAAPGQFDANRAKINRLVIGLVEAWTHGTDQTHGYYL
jgi:hypothetical protein